VTTVQTQVFIRVIDRASRYAPPTALVFAVWAIDAYAFNGRYRSAALNDINYYAKTFNDGVQGLMKRLNP
jgi:hypothetical protein